MRRQPFPLLVAAASLLAIAASVLAQPTRAAENPAHVAAESGYGVEDLQISVVGYDAMLPYTSLVGWNASQDYILAFTQGNFVFPKVQASLNALIPNGARLESLCLYGFDGEADLGADLRLDLVRTIVDSASGQNPVQETLATLETSGAPGDGVWCDDTLDLPIIYRFDHDDDGSIETMSYSLVVEFTPSDFGLDQGFRMARLAWRREVSPAPDTASFADVPVGSSYHRWVEAAASAGIMQSCDAERAGIRSGAATQPATDPPSGRFCPDAPVTRAQLALYLSRALGLHWPAFGVPWLP